MVEQNPFRLVNQIEKTEQDYIFSISQKDNLLALGSYQGHIHLHDLHLPTTQSTLPTQGILTHVQFDRQNYHLVWSSYKEGNVILWDSRSQQQALTFDCQAPVSTFDINASQTLLGAGTDLVGEDAFLKFFDLRNASTLASFDECHSDDITCVKFHPNTSEALISGSTDGLVCLYNLNSFDQDEALYQVIKDESVSKIGYFGPNDGKKL